MQNRLLFVGKLAANSKTIAYLQDHGYEVTRSEGLRPSLRALSAAMFDLVILDTNDTSKINTRRISHKAARQTNAPFVILLLTDRSSLPEEVSYDEYLVRPFTSRRLETQVRKLLESRRSYVVQLGPLSLDRRTRHVQTGNGVHKLTPKQYALLDYLMRHPGKLVTRRQLMQKIWQTNYLGDTRTLDVHIRWLRERIEENASDPQLLRTHRGRGYSLDLDGPLQEGGDPILERSGQE